jgi:transcriptional regulator with XRE-family HTH domain
MKRAHEPFNVRLYRTRSERGLTMSQVQAATGIAPRMQNAYETGLHLPNTPALTKLAVVLDVSVDYLVGNVADRRRLPRIEQTVPTSDRVKEVRRVRDLSQEGLAVLLKTTRTCVSRWEHGRLPDFWSVAGIAAKCKVSADWLLGFSDEMEVACAA